MKWEVILSNQNNLGTIYTLIRQLITEGSKVSYK